MTDRHAGYLVVLDHDIREDDAEHVINALRMTKGVLSVTPIVSDGREQIAEERVRQRIRGAMFDAVDKATR